MWVLLTSRSPELKLPLLLLLLLLTSRLPLATSHHFARAKTCTSPNFASNTCTRKLIPHFITLSHFVLAVRLLTFSSSHITLQSSLSLYYSDSHLTLHPSRDSALTPCSIAPINTSLLFFNNYNDTKSTFQKGLTWQRPEFMDSRATRLP